MNGMGSDDAIPLDTLKESYCLIERAADSIESFFTLAEEGSEVEIVSKDRLTSRINRIRSRRPIITETKEAALPPGMEHLKNLYVHSIYTDGSWLTKHSLSSLLLGNSESVTAGAMVLHTNRGLLTVKINLDIDTRSAYDAEVISLLLAHELSAGMRDVKVWSDCESAIRCLNGGGLVLTDNSSQVGRSLQTYNSSR
jgi:hypothetical protein